MGTLEDSKDTVILASASPRRRVLLEGAGLRIEVKPVDILEQPRSGEGPSEFALRMAQEKAEAARHPREPRPLLAGDTVVTIDGEILGKPRDVDHAIEMLTRLSGKAHKVITGWALSHDGTITADTTVSEVTFGALTQRQIEDYVATGEPMDKAGGYGIQGYGGALVDHYTGDFSNIVGFPLPDILRSLSLAGVGPQSALGRRYATLLGRTAAACAECDRSPEDVRIIGASKAQSVESVQAGYAAGLRDFGESYVQEFTAKRNVLPDDARWHFIGHLQRNKTRFIVPGIHQIHTVSSIRLAETIAKRARANGITVPCLLQVNIGAEATKSGATVDELPSLLEAVDGIDGVHASGLMAIPPRGGLATSRQWFRRVRTLRDSLATQERPLSELSMGMSGDFDSAIIEGATQVRVGTALFGQRRP